MTQAGITYKDAGVDIAAKTEAIQHFKQRAASTLGAGAGPIGHFGGTYLIPSGPDQILVASADGVGTKLRLAFILGGEAHAGMGRDIVNHCVNDILALGAKPLFFLDYFATGKLEPDIAKAVVGGIADACRDSGMALLGGETAEMPDMYAPGEYDLAGFIVGTVDPTNIIDGSAIQPGDIVIGLPSSGLHTNGYSLARKIVDLNGDLDRDRTILGEIIPGWHQTIGEALLETHVSYAEPVRPLIEQGLVRGMAHITGGGLIDNLPRTLPDSTVALLDPETWEVPPIFDYLIERGRVPKSEWYHVFNMGVGFTLIVQPDHARDVLTGIPGAIPIGEIAARTSDTERTVQGLGD